ncbi:MAG: hypothetical protein CM15mP120_01940 [Pseudomonadota bacterium]|nr:MAG: hypothetical protein CM15mP120_01940 [Pseudomonadota bacterium]
MGIRRSKARSIRILNGKGIAQSLVVDREMRSSLSVLGWLKLAQALHENSEFRSLKYLPPSDLQSYQAGWCCAGGAFNGITRASWFISLMITTGHRSVLGA